MSTTKKRVRGQEPKQQSKRVHEDASDALPQNFASKNVICSNGKPFILQIDARDSAGLSDFARGLTDKPESSDGSRFGHLLHPLPASEFFENCFEKMCVHIQRNTACDGVFSLQQLYDIVEENDLGYEHNMTLCQYTNGVRANLLVEGRISADEIKKQFEDNGLTVQFYQPQRFSDPLWYLQSAFEREFGCLAGASAYLTPANNQGLAPHYDHVCVFVLQTEGSKTWRLYQPSDEIALAEEHSPDLPRDQLGQPQQIVLQPGDVLYMPRGTVHEAVASSASHHSTHVTISVYHKHNYKNFVASMMPLLLDKAFAECMEYRKGLPRDLMSFSGTYADFEERTRLALLGGASASRVIAGDSTAAESSEQSDLEATAHAIAAKRAKLREDMTSLVARLCSYITDDLVSQTTDLLAQDFMQHRLPPPTDAVDLEEGRPPMSLSASSEIRLCDPRFEDNETVEIIRVNDLTLGRIAHRDMRAELAEVAPGEMALFVSHCRGNDRLQHMGHPLEESDDDDDDDEDDEDEEHGEEDEEEENEEGTVSEEGEDSKSSMPLPAVATNAIFFLQSRFPSFTKLKEVEQYMQGALSKEELLSTLEYLYHYGVLDVQHGKPKK